MSLQLASLRRHAAERPLLPTHAPRDPVLVVGSGKGGVGTSTVASLLAVLASETGARVLLVDGDASLGSLHLLFSVSAGPGLGSLRGGDFSVSELLIPLTDTLTLLPGGGDGGEISAAERQALFRRVGTLYEDFDLVVVDGGSRLESVRAACDAGVGRVLAVTTSDRVSVAATYALIKALGQRFAALPVDVLLNRDEMHAAERAADEIREAARHFLHRPVGFAGALPDDACLHAGILAGMSLPAAAAGSPAAAAAQLIASSTLNQLTAVIPAFVERHYHRRS